MAQLVIKNLSKLAPFTGGPWKLPHKFHLYYYYSIPLCGRMCSRRLYKSAPIEASPLLRPRRVNHSSSTEVAAKEKGRSRRGKSHSFFTAAAAGGRTSQNFAAIGVLLYDAYEYVDIMFKICFFV